MADPPCLPSDSSRNTTSKLSRDNGLGSKLYSLRPLHQKSSQVPLLPGHPTWVDSLPLPIVPERTPRGEDRPGSDTGSGFSPHSFTDLGDQAQLIQAFGIDSDEEIQDTAGLPSGIALSRWGGSSQFNYFHARLSGHVHPQLVFYDKMYNI